MAQVELMPAVRRAIVEAGGLPDPFYAFDDGDRITIASETVSIYADPWSGGGEMTGIPFAWTAGRGFIAAPYQIPFPYMAGETPAETAARYVRVITPYVEMIKTLWGE